MAEAATLEIDSEDALWDFLADIINRGDAAEETSELATIGWSPQLFYFPEEQVGHSIRPAVARSVTDFHASLSKAYALAVYGKTNRLLLRKEDREALDLIFIVRVCPKSLCSGQTP